jgi:xylan 1,4-beta-xylosidase
VSSARGPVNAIANPVVPGFHPDPCLPRGRGLLPRSSGGIYAPTLRHHAGRFWLITTNVQGDGNLVVTATDPAGPWSDPVRLPGVAGIDPDLAWDDDGTCWCTVAGVSQVRVDPGTARAFGEPRRIWSGTPGARAPEAPHLYRIGEYWYLLIAEGGTERGHGQRRSGS